MNYKKNTSIPIYSGLTVKSITNSKDREKLVIQRYCSSISDFKDIVLKYWRLVKAKRNVIKRLHDNAKSLVETIGAKDKKSYWKMVLIVDDEPDITTTFKVGIENAHFATNK